MRHWIWRLLVLRFEPRTVPTSAWKIIKFVTFFWAIFFSFSLFSDSPTFFINRFSFSRWTHLVQLSKLIFFISALICEVTAATVKWVIIRVMLGYEKSILSILKYFGRVILVLDTNLVGYVLEKLQMSYTNLVIFSPMKKYSFASNGQRKSFVLVSKSTGTRDLFVLWGFTTDTLMLCSSIYTCDTTMKSTSCLGTKLLLWRRLFQFLGPYESPCRQNTLSDLAEKQITIELVDTGSVTKFSESCAQFRKRWFVNSFSVSWLFRSIKLKNRWQANLWALRLWLNSRNLVCNFSKKGGLDFSLENLRSSVLIPYIQIYTCLDSTRDIPLSKVKYSNSNSMFSITMGDSSGFKPRAAKKLPFFLGLLSYLYAPLKI